MAKRIRPPVKWRGGKYRLAPEIISSFPEGFEDMTYVEPFGGCANVLLQKPRSQVEVYNDLDFELFCMFKVLREKPDALIRSLTLTPYSENEFNESILQDTSDLTEIARRFFTRHRQSYGAKGEKGGFSFSKHVTSRGMCTEVSKWLSSIDQNLIDVVDRLRLVLILNRSFSDIIHRFDSPNTLFYIDPPYVGLEDQYVRDFSYEDQRNLIFTLCHIHGKFLLSGYPNILYDNVAVYMNWCRRSINFTTQMSQKNQSTEETLWANYRMPR